jgi:serralysin
MPGTATTILIDGTPTDGADQYIDSLVWGGRWIDDDGGKVTISYAAATGEYEGSETIGWSEEALAALDSALALWASVANIEFVKVTPSQADVLFWAGTQSQAGGRDILGWSEIPGYNDTEVLNTLFDAQDLPWSGDAFTPGSFTFVTLVHEIGHLLGLAHPHDGGSAPDATTFPGVIWPWDGASGGNSGFYTTMTYNDGFPYFDPDFYDDPYSLQYGLQYGPMAVDIAAIQTIYGANTTFAAGNDTYYLPTTDGLGTRWSSIWDTGGIDTISNAGSSLMASIYLSTTTPYGMGVWSYVQDNSITVHGGYSIAKDVVIENAIGGSNQDTLEGNSANNVLDGRELSDYMAGFGGDDTYYVDDLDDEVVEQAGEGTDTVHTSVDYTLTANVENLILVGVDAIKGTGNGLDNVLTGNELANELLGLAGNDTISGSGGDDLLDGGAGSDVLVGGLGADMLSGGGDADYLLIDGADTAIDGGAGFDSAFVQTAAPVTLDMGASSIEWVQGNAGNDVFAAAGQSSAVYIYGMGGDDTLTGSAFGDYLDGGDGTDTLSGGDGADLMLGNGGVDILRGDGGDDSIIELGGDSVIDGGAGFDSLFVWSDTGVTLDLTAASIEWVQGSVPGDDTLDGAGNTVNTFLYGWGGNDVLTAGSADDYIAGGAGDDVLTGGAGNDTLIGETGFDRYVYTDTVWGSDTIHSFDFNGEKLDFTAVAAIDSFSDFATHEWDPLGLGYNSTTLFYTSGGTTSAITLIGVQTASLSDADFLFA